MTLSGTDLDRGESDTRTAIKLIASDLDGTLLDSESALPERNVEAIRMAAKIGVRFTISTGRMFGSARKFADRLGVEIPIICYNGAMLCHPSGTVISHYRLDMDVALRLLDIFRERDMYVQSYVDDTLYIKDAGHADYLAYVKRYGINGVAAGEDLYRPTTPPTKLLVSTEGAEQSQKLMRELSGIFGDSAYITSSNSEFVEMMNPGVNKGKALRTLADMLGLNMPDVMALGDGENDAEMLREAGLGIAMGNAGREAKDAADVIAPTNDECGMAWAVGKYVLNGP